VTIAFKIGLLAAVAGLGLNAPEAHAAVTSHAIRGNAINYCQAFTPGPANTIRNRVVGSENIGDTINVACAFSAVDSGSPGTTLPTRLSVYFSNNNSSGTITVTCSLLTGYQSGGGYLVTKTTAAIAAGGASQQNLQWTATDNPTPASTTLGDWLVGINCTLPKGAVINDTYLYWNQDNGVGT
jgi:hypothetical protein